MRKKRVFINSNKVTIYIFYPHKQKNVRNRPIGKLFRFPLEILDILRAH